MKKQYSKVTVLIVDAGGRGAALVDAYSRSKLVKNILVVPGNDLMQLNSEKKVVIFPQLKTTSVKEILKICADEQVDLVDVAQDNAVAVGLVDALLEKGIPVLGPTKAAGQIEWDKGWARDFGEKYGLPQPTFKVCHSSQEGKKFLQSQPDQAWFVKAAGLAEGKGALPARNNEEAEQRIKEMERFEDAEKNYVLEQWLQNDDGTAGEEFSTFILSDGEHYQIIGSAQDHKRVNDFDEGENTGGMGVSTPPLMMTKTFLREVEKKIIVKTIAGLQKEGRPYRGVLYLGGIVVRKKGKLVPYVIEFNARWGDPEVEAILPGLKNDLFDLSMAMSEGRLDNVTLKTDGKARIVVAGACKGYPGSYADVKGKQIYGLDEAMKLPGVTVYGAGIKIVNKKYIANGGRLFYIIGEGKNVIDARQKAYAAMARISIAGNNLHYRTDIGWRDVERLRQKNSK